MYSNGRPGSGTTTNTVCADHARVQRGVHGEAPPLPPGGDSEYLDAEYIKVGAAGSDDAYDMPTALAAATPANIATNGPPPLPPAPAEDDDDDDDDEVYDMPTTDAANAVVMPSTLHTTLPPGKGKSKIKGRAKEKKAKAEASATHSGDYESNDASMPVLPSNDLKGANLAKRYAGKDDTNIPQRKVSEGLYISMANNPQDEAEKPPLPPQVEAGGEAATVIITGAQRYENQAAPRFAVPSTGAPQVEQVEQNAPQRSASTESTGDYNEMSHIGRASTSSGDYNVMSHIQRASSGDYNQMNHGLDPAQYMMATASSVGASSSESDGDDDADDYNVMSHTLPSLATHTHIGRKGSINDVNV